MSFLVGGALALGGASIGTVAAGASIGSLVGGMLSGGFGAQSQYDVNVQKGAAADLYQEKLGLLSEQKDLSLAGAQSQFAGGQRDISMGTQIGLRDIKEAGDIAASRSGLATSIDKTKTQTGDLLTKAKSDMTKLFDTRSLVKAEADLSYRSGAMSAEDAYQSTLTDIDSQPTGFLEGLFS